MKRTLIFAAMAALSVTAAMAALPSGYTEVEYIASSGGQYIDTGVVPKSTTRLVCDFRLTAMPTDRVRCGWGSAGSKEAFWFGTDNNHVYFSSSVSGNSVQANTGVPVDTSRHTFDISASAVKFDDATVANPGVAFTDAASGNTMYLFASRQGWNPAIGAYGSMEIYSCKIYSGDTPVRDFVPAVRDLDGKAGLYDRVTDAFFGNLGTGDFTAGQEVRYYVGVEYIESDGDQYIDTLWTNGSDHVITLDIQPTVPPTTGGTGSGGIQTYYGCRNAASDRNISMFLDYLSSQPTFSIDFNNNSYSTYRLNVSGVSTAYRYIIVDSAALRTARWYDAGGTPVSSAANDTPWGSNFSCAGSAYLFAANDMSGGSPAVMWNKAKMKFYGGTVTTADGDPCCNLVPCLRNGVEPGVYDTVRDLFLPNAGSGTFTYGAETGVIYGLEPQGDAFAVSPIPDQLAATPAALAAGIAPSVTVSNLATSVELVQGTHYTVAYSNNTVTGTAYAIVTGVGDYDEESVVVPFLIDCPFDASNFDHTMTITPSVGKVTSTLTNFPVLVRLSGTRQPWFNPADCAANGADLRFTLADGTLLAHEIDTWNSSGESLVWVNVPSLSASTVVTAYWGAKNAAFLPIVNPADAWPDFIAVYHLGEGDATARDSSANGYDAVNAAAVTLGSNPKVGGCARITANYDTGVWNLVGPSAAKPLSDRSRLTMSAWVAWDAYASASEKTSANISIGKKWTGWGDQGGGFDCRFFEAQPYFGLVLNSGTGSGTLHNWNSDVAATGGSWMYLTCTINDATAAKYVNGTLLLPDKYNGGGAMFGGNPTTTLAHGVLGPDTGPYKFGATLATGRMDEVRLRDGVASAAWIAADYAQQNVDDFLFYAEPVDEAFTVSPIPDQTVSSIAELFAGLTPSVTVSNLTTGTGLSLGTDYTVTYTGNTSIGLAYAVVVGRGEYAAYTNSAPFVIGGIDAYYIVGGTTYEAAGSSSVSGDVDQNGSPTGWSATKGGSKSANGVTAANSIYYVWTDRSNRIQYNKDYATPVSSAIIIEPSCKWGLGDKMLGNTLTLNNLFIRAGGTLAVDVINDSGTLFNNTIAGNYILEDGATLWIASSKNSDAIKQYTLSASVTGRGAIVMPTSSVSLQADCLSKITGTITNFTGDIRTWNGGQATSTLELVNAVSLPGDPAPEEIAYVVVTNSATLKIDQDWTSPTNRIWILGDAGTPTINVPSGKTVTIDGDLVGSVGFKKTGTGTLVIRGASPAFSGEITINQGVVRFAGQGARVAASAGVTLTEDGGTYEIAALFVSPVPVQVVGSLDVLAAGIRPTMVVSNLEAGVELALGTDYTVSYANNTSSGIATVTVTGAGTYEGMEKSVNFIIHAVKEVTSNYNLAADEDWTGFESVTVASGFVIDLKGHNLTISGLNGAGEITDSVGGGELHYAVPAVFGSGYAATITNVALTGYLKLVKDGPGLLVTSKKNQGYTGGTDILGGVLRSTQPPGDSPLGPASSASHARFYIGPNGTFDPAGTQGWANHDLTIAGGAVSNTVAASPLQYGVFNANITFTADSTFATVANYGWTVGELDGHTITVSVVNTLYLQTGATPPTSGRLNVVRGGWIRTFGGGRAADFAAIDLDCNAALYLEGTVSVHDYTPRYTANNREGSAVLKVYGTFTPVNEYFFAPTMQDGSAIDLSAKTGAWNSKSSSSGTPSTHFAEGASVAILLGGRTPAIGEKIVTWTAATKPADSVSLTNATYVLRAEDDGLYVDSLRTFAANDLPDIAEAKLASDLAAAIESSLVMTDIVTGETLALGTDYTYSFSVSGSRCTVTVTGLGGHDGATVVRTFDIGRISLRQSAFAYSMEIRPTDGKLTTTLTNFPVLVRLSADIPRFSYGKCKADELRFALPDGTLLSHEIDWWNENGESTVWVNVPELTSNTVFTAYWGMAAGREALRTADETWPEYVGVWHFSEASGIVHDSSGNGYHSTNNGGGTVSNMNAKVGLARNVASTRFYMGVTDLTRASAAKRITNVSRFSISGWMLSTATIGNAQYPDLMRKGQMVGNGWFACFEASPTKFNGVGTGDTRTKVTIPTSVYNNWVYLTVVFNDTSCSVYEDGALVETYDINKVSNSTYELQLANALTGRIDEYRIHNGTTPADYIAADYATQTDAGFLTFGKVKHSGATMLLMR